MAAARTTRKAGAKAAAGPAKKAVAKAKPARKTAAQRRAEAEAQQAMVDAQCLMLRRSGFGFNAICDQLGYADLEAAVAGYERALGATGQQSIEALLPLELDRLDQLHQVLWPKALRGDGSAIASLLSLAVARERVAPHTEGDCEKDTRRELEAMAATGTALGSAALAMARHVDRARSASAAASAGRELRLMVATIHGMPLVDVEDRPAGEVVPESRLAQLRRKHGDNGRR